MRTNDARSCLRAIAAGSLLAAAGACVGCSGGPVDGYRLDPTPSAMTMSENGNEVANLTTTTFDTNFREMNEDVARLLLIDKPTLLSPKPVPH